MMTFDFHEMVKQMKSKEETDKKHIVKIIQDERTLTNKCILSRRYLPPQSTIVETMCKQDLGIGNAFNKTSGDGHKNGIKYEIKTSIHAKKSKLNFLQIRPDHDIDYYILIAYNMYGEDEGKVTHTFSKSHRLSSMILFVVLVTMLMEILPSWEKLRQIISKVGTVNMLYDVIQTKKKEKGLNFGMSF